MNRKNNWNKDIGTQANSYIEKRFEDACEFIANGEKMLNEWRRHKELYITYTSTIIFDFQHYSRHDVTHSVKILEAIELILGTERVDKLNAGDLWLLLEAAYFHDIGMAVTYEDLIEIWDSKDFHKYLESGMVQADADLREAKDWYVQMDNLVHDREKLLRIENEDEIEFEKNWPIELERKLLLLITSYIRRDHAKRCKVYLKRFEGNQTGSIPERLYQMVAEIAVSHGEKFTYVLEQLKVKSQGLGMDYVHPQFIAALLRLGDLLDMDNNRFNLRALEHYGDVPITSRYHLRKHKAMTHIMICWKKIEAEAASEELEVCQITRDWFHYIEQEVVDLICHWSEIAPEQLQGCLMQKADCRVYHPRAPIEFRSERQKKFEVDKVKLTELLIGVNIYDIKMDFLREYVQNALDASKMQLWLDLKNGKYQYQYNPEIQDISKLAPFDIPPSVYDQYTIEIKISVDIISQQVAFEIIDHGIGMEEACLDVISKIGLGWRGRKAYCDEIPKMLRWLKPTGGFGIGIQSAFMLTDEIELLTKSEVENETHKVILNSPKTTGAIIEETGPQNNMRDRGTIVRLKIGMEYFQKWNEEYEKDKLSDQTTQERKNTVKKLLGRSDYKGEDVFAENDTLDYIIHYVEEYLKDIVANTIIPIRITNPGRKPIIYYSPYLVHDHYWTDPERYIPGTEMMEDQIYRWIYDTRNNALLIWAEKDAIYTYLKISGMKNHVSCFKNICVVRDTDFDYPLAAEFDICIDFMGFSAERALKVHRNAYNEDFSQIDYVRNGVYIYIKVMLLLEQMKVKLPEYYNEEKENISKQLYKKVYENLYQSNISWIRLLYLEPDMPIRDSVKKLDVINICVDIQSMQDGSKKAEIKETYDKRDTAELLQKAKEILSNGKDEELFVICPDKRVFSVQDLRDQLFHNLCGAIITGEESVAARSFPGQRKIIERMIEGITVIKDNQVYALLSECKLFTEKVYHISVDKIDRTITVFSKKKKVNYGDTLNDEQFYKDAYNDVGRRLFAMPDAMRYEKLRVSRLPFDKTMVNPGPYLISPIDTKARVEFTQKTEANKNFMYQKVYLLSDFIDFILRTEEFQAMLEWVYRNQVEAGKYKKDELRDEYIHFISDIYQKYLYEKKLKGDIL